jgi:hypothetical protein
MLDLPGKDASVRQLLKRLAERLGSNYFHIVDHWPDDPYAIGLTRPDNPAVLAYVCTVEADPDRIFVSLELPPAGEWADTPYSPAGDQNVRGFDELAAIIERHLSQAVV